MTEAMDTTEILHKRKAIQWQAIAILIATANLIVKSWDRNNATIQKLGGPLNDMKPI